MRLALKQPGRSDRTVYVQRHFPESAKAQMDELVENLRAALRQSIEQNDWMSADTKEEAYKKLEAFRPKIAYPDEWRDFSSHRYQQGQSVPERAEHPTVQL